METKSLRIREEKIMMPTYRILDKDPLPGFFGPYPYNSLNNFDDKVVPVNYHSLVVENEYLQARVIPSLGARLYDLFDKINNVHVFHYNEIVRPTLEAVTGAWLAGGIEFNSLDRAGHTPDNFLPVDYKLEEKEDRVTMYIGNLNLSTNIYWLVGLTLRPGKQFLEVEIKTFNSDPLYSKYYFWSNSGESVTLASRVFIPGKHTFTQERGGLAEPFPIQDGMDVSWYKNDKMGVDAFIIDSEEDFFGYYDYDMKRGVVHHANHFQVLGKKRFTYGSCDEGLVHAPARSDKGIPYIELQSGRFRSQGIVEFIDPHFFEEWREWWYPIAKIGGISFANKDAAIYLDNKPEEVFTGVYVTKEFPNSKIKVYCGEEVFEEIHDLSPGNPFIKNYNVKTKNAKVEVFDENGKEIIRWDGREYKTKMDELVFAIPTEFKVSDRKKKSMEELWLDAQWEDKRGSRFIAELKYQRLLEMEPDFSRGLFGLAVLYYRQGKFPEGIELLKRAVKRDPSYEDAHYYLGLSYFKVGNHFDSETELWKARASLKYFSPASYQIALIKIINGEYAKAEGLLSEVLERNGKDINCLFMYAAVSRRQGKIQEALKSVRKALAIMPLYYPALAERMMCSKGLEEYKEAAAEFKRVVLAETTKILEVAKEYICAGFYQEAEEVLKMGLGNNPNGPMIHYYLGFIYEKIGKLKERDEAYRQGNSKSPDYVFPHRLEELEILRSVKETTGEPKVSYYLGNLLFSVARFKEGVEEWETAKRKGLRYFALHRNLGNAYYTIYRDAKKALMEYETAIGMDSLNHRLHLEYDEICSWRGLTEKRIVTLEKAREEIKKRSILARLFSAYLEKGEYEKVLEILTKNDFTPGEGGFYARDKFVDAHIRKGVKNLREKKYKEALEDFQQSLQFPKNLDAGAPYPPNRHEAMQRYWLGECYFALGEKGKARKNWEEIFIQKKFTPEENLYKGLALRRLGKRKEALSVFRNDLKEFSEKEKNLLAFKKIAPEYFHALNYDNMLATYYHIKTLSYLGLGRRREARVEFKKAQKITKVIPVTVYLFL